MSRAAGVRPCEALMSWSTSFSSRSMVARGIARHVPAEAAVTLALAAHVLRPDTPADLGTIAASTRRVLIMLSSATSTSPSVMVFFLR